MTTTLSFSRFPTKVRGKAAELLDKDKSGTLDESELIAAVEELLDYKRANYILKWVVIALIASLLLATASIVGITYALLDAQKDTQSSDGSFQDRATGSTLRTAQAEMNLDLDSDADVEGLLEDWGPSSLITADAFIDMLEENNVPVPTDVDLYSNHAISVKKGMLETARGVSVMGIMSVKQVDKLCKLFDEGHKNVQFNIGSHQKGIRRMEAELYSTYGCKGGKADHAFFSFIDPGNNGGSLVLECRAGGGGDGFEETQKTKDSCALLNYSPISLELPTKNTTFTGGEEDLGQNGRRLLQRNDDPNNRLVERPSWWESKPRCTRQHACYTNAAASSWLYGCTVNKSFPEECICKNQKLAKDSWGQVYACEDLPMTKHNCSELRKTCYVPPITKANSGCQMDNLCSSNEYPYYLIYKGEIGGNGIWSGYKATAQEYTFNRATYEEGSRTIVVVDKLPLDRRTGKCFPNYNYDDLEEWDLYADELGAPPGDCPAYGGGGRMER
jgi:hypothetical protein